LVKESAIIIQSEKRVSEEKTGDSSENTSEEEEIDWDGVQVALDANKEIYPKTFTRQKCGEDNLCRSARIPNDKSKVLDKAELSKRSIMKYQVISRLLLFLIQLVPLLLKI
jgi:hypothetical protein